MTSGLPQPYFQLMYRGTDISGDLDPMTTSVSYADQLHGEADEIEVTVQDKDGRWKGSWHPEHGDEMELTIFDGQGGILPCGAFEMDEPEASGDRGGDLMTIRGLAAPISKPLRSKKTVAYEKQTTRSIVSAVAGRLGMSFQGDINELFHERVTQRRERDLEFLKRLGEETGHYVNLRGSSVIFTSFASIDGQTPAQLIYHGDRSLIDYSFKFQSNDTYSKGKATYLDERKGRNNEYEEEDPRVTTGDTMRISGERLESASHAQARVKSKMHFANRKAFSGSVTQVGSVRLLAGTVANLIGFGRYSGNRLVNSSTHTLGRDGYTSAAELVDARA
ncbi:hypothetical protein [uncultured Pelagimonas sp.]|uniref:phage late control D family protein n=1 Tax=uncultured Pelagimonas sp. TaxID=1618102 RepID=UPI0026336FD3|nr:hypothetical protein [uncultured Pelagimonas sp.]